MTWGNAHAQHVLALCVISGWIILAGHKAPMRCLVHGCSTCDAWHTSLLAGPVTHLAHRTNAETHMRADHDDALNIS